MPLDKACEVEGAICSIQSTKESLLKEMEELKGAEEKLKTDLKKCLDEPAQHPIIEDFKPNVAIDLEEEHLVEKENLNSRFEIGLSLSDESLIGTPTPASPPGVATPSRQVLFINDEETIMSEPALESSRQRSESPLVRGAFCGGSLFPILRSASEDEENIGGRLQGLGPRRNDVGESSPRNPETVDFRTGLSGHIALNISRRKTSSYNMRRNEIRMMGEHRGIASLRKIRKQGSESPR